MRQPKSLKHNEGFTLVELMVALALGLMLSAGIVNVYLENRRNAMQDEEIARLQENARYALRLLKRELTMAGFVGGKADYGDVTPGSVVSDCVGSGDWAIDVSGDVFELINNVTPGSTLQTINGTTWTCLPSSDLVEASDVISVKRTADHYTLKNGNFDAGVSEDDRQWYLRVFDGDSTEWTYLDTGESFPAADTTSGSKVDYWEYYSQIFYLRNYSRAADDGIPTLCVAALRASSMSSECLVEGIEDLQIEVGIDTNNDSVPDQFKANPSTSEIAEAVVVRIYLLVRSINRLPDYSNNKAYKLGSKDIIAKNDRYIRRVFSTTIQMRNAKLPNA